MPKTLTVSVNAAALATGLSTQSIRRLIGGGELEATKLGRRVLVNFESLSRLVTEGDRPRQGGE